MNRLIIIGNGFDLAHGLPTSYKDFINDYWSSVCDTNGAKSITFRDELVSVSCQFGGSYNTMDYDMIDNMKSYDELKIFYIRNLQKRNGVFNITFNNQFFETICNLSIDNWVDIENEYYSKLKIITKHGSLKLEEKKEHIQLLNKEFEQVKILLEKYLKEKILNVFNLHSYQDREGDFFKFQKCINPISIYSKESGILEEFHKKDHKEIEAQFEKERNDGINHSRLQILNFNYTHTPGRYINGIKSDVEVNFIHGIIDNKTDNKINFGFGDEMDDDYKAIENINDNEYLRNFKSFSYLQNSNYKQLLDFIEDDKFQIYIMGHSCGLSDRTLLNTVFEHDNCRSIKVFYHQREDGTDNYTEIIQNISRHFNKKKSMREKIVNKTLCKPLPKIQLRRK